MCIGDRPHLKPGASIKAAVNIRMATLGTCAVSMPDVCLCGCCINAKHTVEVTPCDTHSLRTKALPGPIGLQKTSFVSSPAFVTSPQVQIADALMHAVHFRMELSAVGAVELECTPQCLALQRHKQGSLLGKQTFGSKVSSETAAKGVHVLLGYPQLLK